jgi:putative inorganic carbon (HCO3(-)) transporter
MGCGALPGLFLLVTSTTHLVNRQFVYDVKRLLQLCLMLVLFLAAALSPVLRRAFAAQSARIPIWIKAILCLIVALGVVSSINAATSTMHAAYSLLEVALLSMLVLAALVIAACRSVAGELFDQVAITLLALTAIAVGIQEILGVFAALANQLEFYARISLMHFSWPRFYNQVQAWTLPALAALPLIWSGSRSDLLRSRWVQSTVCLAALALNWYVILMTGGRGVAISIVAAVLIALIVLPATRWPILRWHLAGFAIGMLLFMSIAHLSDTTLGMGAADTAAQQQNTRAPESSRANSIDEFERPDDGSRFSKQAISGRLSLDSSGRLPMWRDSVRDVHHKPLLGIGPMNYACTGPEFRAGHPHNFLLQFAGEWGLPATLSLLGLLGFITTSLFKNLRVRKGQHWAALGSILACALLAAGAYSLLSGVLVMPASQVSGLLIAGWLMGLIPAARYSGSPGKAATIIVLTSGLIVCGLVTGFSVIEASKREYRETRLEVADNGIPRFWQQGKICKYLDRY